MKKKENPLNPPAGAGTDNFEPRYRIGAVSKLTRIPAPTLRMWEHRYGLAKSRPPGERARLYSRDDVVRLTLIKQLVEQGNPISRLANLTLQQLQAMGSPYTASGAVTGTEPAPAVALIGGGLVARYRQTPQALMSLHVVAMQGLDEFLEKGTDADQAIIECEILDEDILRALVATMERSNVRQAIVIYRFASSSLLREVPAMLTLVRAPLSLEVLERLCLSLRQPPPRRPAGKDQGSPAGDTARTDIPPPRFDAGTLLRIAGASTTIKCECPRHLVELISSLSAFERYSANCENRNAEDAALHAHLHQVTAHCRAMIEDALVRLAEADGIDIGVRP